MNPVDPVSLKLFVRVVELGTISAAAAAEHLSGAAISKRISELEGNFSTPLLARTNKGIEPTAAGLALLKLARSALAELDQVKVQMESFSTGVRGMVRICASMSAITQFLAHPLRSFLDLHPDVQIQLEERTSPLVAKAVAENAADIGIYLPVISAPPGLEELAYQTDRLVVITSKTHQLAARKAVKFDELVDHGIVGLHTSSAINVLLARATQEARKHLNIRIQVTSFDALCMMVSTGLGVGVMPESVAKRNSKTIPLHICRLDEPWSKRQFMICVRERAALPHAALLMLDHLLATRG